MPFFVNITDATVSDQSLLKGLFHKLPRGSWLSFDMGYVNYEAWQEFTDNGIFYVTKEKKRTKAEVLETNLSSRVRLRSTPTASPLKGV